MSIGSLWLRFMFSAKPFASDDLDDLASRMSALPMMSKDRNDRWFRGRGTTAYSTATRVIFGRDLDERLSDGQRRAVAAHELVHVRERDASYANWHIRIPSLVIAALAYLLTLWWLRSTLPEGIFMTGELIFSVLPAVFMLIIAIVVFRLLARPWRRRAEVRCDVIAASVVSPDDLISALRIQEGLLTPKMRKAIAYRLWKGEYPPHGERERAIREHLDRQP